jgi:hypothetical protein
MRYAIVSLNPMLIKFVIMNFIQSSFNRPLGTASLSQADACDSFRSIFILGIVEGLCTE